MREMPTTLDLTPDEVALYRATAEHRRTEEQAEISRLLQEAWETAGRAARLLREQFWATRVVVFGSLVHKACFTRWSDVDIAAWGIAPDDTLRAIGAVMDMDAPIEINLVDVNACRPSLLEVIEQDGVEV